MPNKANTIRALATALELGVARTHSLTKEPWFPPKDVDGWDLELVELAIAAHKRGEHPVAPPQHPPRGKAPENEEPTDREVLEEGSDPIAIARAALRVAAHLLVRHLPGAPEAETEGHPRFALEGAKSTLESVKRSLEELRRTEAGYLELQKQRGLVVELDVAKAVGAKTGRRFVVALERLESKFASQVELWLSHKQFRDLGTAERGRAIRAWVLEQTTAARNLEGDEVEKLIVAEIEDAES